MSDVFIHHPLRDRTLKVPSALFPGRLAAKGWVLVDDDTPDRRAALLAEAAELGLRIHPKAKDETIARKIAEARGQVPA